MLFAPCSLTQGTDKRVINSLLTQDTTIGSGSVLINCNLQVQLSFQWRTLRKSAVSESKAPGLSCQCSDQWPTSFSSNSTCATRLAIEIPSPTPSLPPTQSPVAVGSNCFLSGLSNAFLELQVQSSNSCHPLSQLFSSHLSLFLLSPLPSSLFPPTIPPILLPTLPPLPFPSLTGLYLFVTAYL